MTGADPWSLGTQTVDNDYPADWGTRRRMVYRRDDYTCQNCGAGGGPHGDTELHAHHIVPKSQGGSHSLNNLTTLCYECHNAVHDHHIPRQTGPRETSVSSDDNSSDVEISSEPIDVDDDDEADETDEVEAWWAETVNNLAHIGTQVGSVMVWTVMWLYLGVTGHVFLAILVLLGPTIWFIRAEAK